MLKNGEKAESAGEFCQLTQARVPWEDRINKELSRLICQWAYWYLKATTNCVSESIVYMAPKEAKRRCGVSWSCHYRQL